MSTPVPPRGSRARSTSTRPGSRPTNRPNPNASRGTNRPGTRPPARGRQAAFARKRRQQRLLFGGIGLVVVIVVVLVVVAVTSGGGSGGSNTLTPASPAVLRQIQGVAPEAMATQATSDSVSPPTAITGAALTSAGKPKVMYLGAEYCPYCGGERWAMIMALSKFGTFTGIKQITSSSSDSPSSIPTFSFVGSNFRSRYLVFEPTETQDVNRNPLQNPSAENTALENKYDTGGGIPFLDIGGKWVISGASYDVTPMQHLSHATVAHAVATGSTKYGSDIQATAGLLVSRLCNLTGGQPGNVCRSFPSVIGK